jgi:Leucine-rich repeat (LRR) protein
MKSRPSLINTATFVLALFWAQSSILVAQTTPNPSQTTRLTISEKNAILLKNLKEYSNLEVLSISCVESLQALPDDIGYLPKLRELNMNNGNGCSMNPKLPDSIGNLQALEKLDLYGAQDPRPIGKHYGPQPIQRHEFPKSMSQLKALTYLDLGRNGLDEIPDFVKDLMHLKEFRFAWNMNVRALPSFLATLPELQTLRLDSDGLTDIPAFLKGPKLSLISLGNNCAITTNASKKKALEQRFHGVTLDFEDEYDCPEEK